MEFEKTERISEAFEAAVKYLAASPRSEKEVREKLYSKGFHRNEVDGAIEKAKTYHYIDDENYVKLFIESYFSRYGRKKLLFKLISEKGVNKELATNMLCDLIDDEAEEEKALSVAVKYLKNKPLDKKTVPKVYAYLAQKGVEGAIINRVVRRLFADAETTDIEE